MTQEEKELLLKDLFNRLLYGVNVLDYTGRTYKLQLGNAYLIDLFYGDGDYVEAPIRPYLRPMSSMTEEEKKEFEEQFGFELDINEIWGHSLVWNTGSSDEYIDVEFELDDIDLVSVWLDMKMFDWRRIKKDNKRISMIKAGLALEAPKDMYK